MSVKLPTEFATKIAEQLNWKLAAVQDFFDFTEDKTGFFWAKLKPKKFLEKPDFNAVCKLARTLGGEDYLQGARAWNIPGPLAKKKTEQPQRPLKPESEPAQILPSPWTLLPLKALLSMPFQSRVDVEGPDFEDLVESIRVHGVLEPILARPKDMGLYETVAGERRKHAAEKAGLIEIPAVVRIMSDQEAYEIQLCENVQRKDLTGMEKGRMLDFMIKKFAYTQDQLAKKVGKDQGWVSRQLAMLQLPNIMPRGIMEKGEITEYQAREILAAPEEKRQEVLNKINETGQVPSARAIHEIAHPHLPCARCGEPIQGTPVHLGEGKYYDAECAEQVVAESKGQSVVEEKHVGPFEEPTTTATLRNAEMQVHEVARDVGDFTCPQCKQNFRIVHLPSGKHKFEPVRQA